MRPILLNGHFRPLTVIKYNQDGDLLFSASKDVSAAVWLSDSGERLGTYDGHTGAIFDLDVSADSSLVATCSGDGTAIIYNCQTGENLAHITLPGPGHTVCFSEGHKMLFTLAKSFARPGVWQLSLFEIPESVRNLQPLEDIGSLTPVQVVDVPEAVSGVWMPLNRGIMIGTNTGELQLFRFIDGRVVDDNASVNIIHAHENKINRIEFNKEKTLFITASKDNTAKLFDSRDLVCRKRFVTPAPINHAAISPLFDHVMTGGGQDAKDVTTTSTRQGNFVVRFFHTIYAEEFGRVKGHFGPVNTGTFGIAAGAPCVEGAQVVTDCEMLLLLQSLSTPVGVDSPVAVRTVTSASTPSTQDTLRFQLTPTGTSTRQSTCSRKCTTLRQRVMGMRSPGVLPA